MRFCKSCDDWGFPASFGSHCLGVRRKGEEKQNTLLNRRKRKLSEKSGPWDYINRFIWEKYFPRGQMPSARQKCHQTVWMKLADCQDSCRVFVLTSRSDHVFVYATAKLIMDGGLPNYRPTRLNDSGNFFRPLTKNRRFFHIFIFLFEFAQSCTTLVYIIGCRLDGQIVLD